MQSNCDCHYIWQHVLLSTVLYHRQKQSGDGEDTQNTKLLLQQPAQVNTYPGFKLLALIVDLPQACEMGLGLMFEEGIVQNLVVNVQLANLGLHAVPLLLLQLLVFLFLLQHRWGLDPKSTQAGLEP